MPSVDETMPFLKPHFLRRCCGLILGLLGSGIPCVRASTNDVGPSVSTHVVVHEASPALDSHADRVVMKPDQTPEASRVQHELPASSSTEPQPTSAPEPEAKISHVAVSTSHDEAEFSKTTAAIASDGHRVTEGSPQFLLSVNLVNQEPTATGDVYLVKVTLLREQLGQQVAAAPILLWNHDSGVSTLMLRPFDQRSWISRIEPGRVKGKQQLDLVVYWTSVTGEHRMTTQSYHFDVRDQILTRINTEEFGPAAQPSVMEATGEKGSSELGFEAGPHEVNDGSHALVSLPMVGVHVLWLNLLIAFAAGLSFACYHHLPQAWIDRLSGEHHQVRARSVAVTQLRRMQSTAAAAETNRLATAAEAAAAPPVSTPSIDAPRKDQGQPGNPGAQQNDVSKPVDRVEAAIAALATVGSAQQEDGASETLKASPAPASTAEAADSSDEVPPESTPAADTRPIDIGNQPLAMTDLLAQLKAAGIGSGAPAGSPLAAASPTTTARNSAAPASPEPAEAVPTSPAPIEHDSPSNEPLVEPAAAEAGSSDEADFEAMAAAMMGTPATPTSSGGYLVFGDEGADEMSEEELAALGHPVPVAQNPLSNTQLEDLLAEARTQSDIGAQSTIIEAEPPAQPPFIDSDEIDALLRTYTPTEPEQASVPQSEAPATESFDEPPPLRKATAATDGLKDATQLPAGTPIPEASAADNLLDSLKKLLPRAQNPRADAEPAPRIQPSELPEPVLAGVGGEAGHLEDTENLPEPLQTPKPTPSEPATPRTGEGNDDDDLKLDFNDLSF